MEHLTCMEKMRNAYKVYPKKLKGKGPLGRFRHSRADSIKMDPKEVGCEGGEWINIYLPLIHLFVHKTLKCSLIEFIEMKNL